MLGSQADDSLFTFIFFMFLILLIVYSIAGAVFEIKHFHWLHETGLGIILGCIFGGVVVLIARDKIQEYSFNQQIFFFGLLPPMIFEGGYNLRKTLVFKNFTYIALFGVLGTIISFFVILGLTFAINSMGIITNDNDGKAIDLSARIILIYSATICATDSVAALTMIKPNQYPKLFSIVFGEGMINDAVAIILFRSVQQLSADHGGGHNQFTFTTVKQIFINFIANLVYSFLIGLFTAILCSITFKKMEFLSKNVVAEVMFSLFFGLLSYAFAEYCEYSGVIAVFVCGIVMGHYNFYNLSTNGKISTGLFFKFLSFLSQSFIFVYLGFSSWFYILWTDQDKQGDYIKGTMIFVVLQIIVCAIARFVSIFVLSGIMYLLFMKKTWKVNVYELGIVWFAGIIRGSVAFALILSLNPQGDDESERVNIVKCSVLFIVFFTTVVFGAIMPAYIKCSLGRASKMIGNIPQERASLISEKKKDKKPGFFKTMDQGFFKRWFIRDYEQRKAIMAEEKKLMKLSSSQYKGVKPRTFTEDNTEENLAAH